MTTTIKGTFRTIQGTSLFTHEQSAPKLTHGPINWLNRFIFGGSLALVILVAIPYGTVELWWEALFEVAVFALGALWIIEGLLNGKTRRGSGARLMIPVALIVFFAFAQTLNFGWLTASRPMLAEKHQMEWTAISVNPFETRLVVHKLVALALAGWLLRYYTLNERRLRALCLVVISVGTISALFGLTLQALSHAEIEWHPPLLDPATSYGQFPVRNHFALLMEMTFGLAVGFAFGLITGRRANQFNVPALLILLLAALLMCVALIQTSSRGGVFSLLGQTAFIMLFFHVVKGRDRQPGETQGRNSSGDNGLVKLKNHFFMRFTLCGALTASVLGAVMWVGGDRLQHRLALLPNEVGTDTQNNNVRANSRRLDIWRATWSLIKEHPFVGVGYGAYADAITMHHDASGQWTPSAAHNEYLDILAAGGAIGTALWVWLGITLLRRALKQLRSNNAFQRAACFGALSGLFAVALHSLVDYGLHITINALIFVALLVIATSDLTERQDGPVPSPGSLTIAC